MFVAKDRREIAHNIPVARCLLPPLGCHNAGGLDGVQHTHVNLCGLGRIPGSLSSEQKFLFVDRSLQLDTEQERGVRKADGQALVTSLDVTIVWG